MSLELDLSRDTLDDMPGRSIRFFECDYVLGDMIGYGGESVVFALRSKLSGACLHVAKIRRDNLRDANRVKKEVSSLLHGKLDKYGIDTPPEMRCRVGNGSILVQEYAGLAFEHFAEPTEALTKALKLAQGEQSEAAELLDRVIEEQPYNPVALCALAEIHSANEGVQEATTLFKRAVEAEPNVRRHHYGYISECGKAGAAPAVEAAYKRLRVHFDMPHPKIADIVFSSAVNAGKLDFAESLCQENGAWADDADRKEARAALEEVRRGRDVALALLREARVHEENGRQKELDACVEKAYESCPYDWRVATSYACLQRRSGQHANAVALFSNVLGKIDNAVVYIAVQANLGYSLIELGQAEVGVDLLASSVAMLFEPGDNPPSCWDFPAVARLFGAEGGYSESYAEAIQIIDSVPRLHLQSDDQRGKAIGVLRQNLASGLSETGVEYPSSDESHPESNPMRPKARGFIDRLLSMFRR